MSANGLRSTILAAWVLAGMLLASMLSAVHGASATDASFVALRMMVLASVLAWPVYRATGRYPWPAQLRPGFVLVHVVIAVSFGGAWLALNTAAASLTASVHAGQWRWLWPSGPALWLNLVAGTWICVLLIAVSNVMRATQRIALVNAAAARAQLAAMRAQFHPHLLFNTLHTVIHLIPDDPRRAVQAAEELAALMRAATGEQSDVVSLRQEWAFVQGYLRLESLRFADRLSVVDAVEEQALDGLVPTWSLQTLVENAVRHGVARRIAPTRIAIDARRHDDTLLIEVRDDGPGLVPGSTGGTGLRRLRERIALLCPGATLSLEPDGASGCIARLCVPQRALWQWREHEDD